MLAKANLLPPIVQTDLQHKMPRKDRKCPFKVKRSQKKNPPRPDLLAHSLRPAVDLLNNLTSLCVSAKSLKGFWSSTFSLHNDTRSIFFFFAWLKGAWLFLFHRCLSFTLEIICLCSKHRTTRDNFKHDTISNTVVLFTLIGTVRMKSPLTFDKAASNIRRELFYQHTHTSGQMD